MKKQLFYVLIMCLFCSSAMAMQNQYQPGDTFVRNNIQYEFVSKNHPTSTAGMTHLEGTGWVKILGNLNSLVQQDQDDISDDAYASAMYAATLIISSREAQEGEEVKANESLKKHLEGLSKEAITMLTPKFLMSQFKKFYMGSKEYKTEQEKKKDEKYVKKVNNIGTVVLSELVFDEDDGFLDSKDLIKKLGLLENDRIVDLKKVHRRISKIAELYNKVNTNVSININNDNSFTTNTSSVSITNSEKNQIKQTFFNGLNANLSEKDIKRFKKCYQKERQGNQTLTSFLEKALDYILEHQSSYPTVDKYLLAQGY
jgi:hypothetical protein